MKTLLLLFALALPMAAQQRTPAEWRLALNDRLAFYGHRNWIVIADSAYPLQSGPGIETVLSNESQIETLRHVLQEVGKNTRIRPVVYLDKELSYVPEPDAVGISAYRQLLTGLFEKSLPGQKINPTLHESIIHRLDEASKTFNVLIIKTNMMLPYTSVFLELRAGYWGDEQEERLRQAMPN